MDIILTGNKQLPEFKICHILVISILCITILEIIAILKGFNGTIFSLSLSAITGITGYLLKHKKVL